MIKVTYSGIPSLNYTVDIDLLFGINSSWRDGNSCNITSETVDCMQVITAAANTTTDLKDLPQLNGSNINCTIVKANKRSPHYQGKVSTVYKKLA